MSSCVVVVAVIALGCDTVKAPASIGLDPLPIEAYPQQVAVGGLSKGLVSERAIVDEPTDDSPLSVTVPLRSIVDHALHVQYRFQFFDDAGRPVKDPSQWVFISIAPRVQERISGNALDLDAVDWRLQVRSAR